jgi:hypothetical protein
VLRLRHFAIFGLLSAFVVATAVAQEKKDPPKDPVKEVKKDDAKKADVKKDEPKKDDVKKDEAKKDDAKKKDEPKKDEPGLAWKFTKDKPFYQKMTTSTEQNIKVMGLDVTQKQDQTFYFKWTPLEEKDGVWQIKQEIEGIKMQIDIAGNPVSFDSTQDNPAGGANTALAEFFKALKGASFTLSFNTKTMKVDKVEGKDEFLKKLATANPALEQILKKILTDDALKQMADPTFGILPPTAKKKDEFWEVPSTLNLGPIGTYSNKYKYTYKGPDEKNKDLDLITVETKLTYAVPTESDPALPFKIKSSTLVSKDGQAPGKILFNTKLGRLESSEIKLAIGGELTIDIGGNSTKVELSQTQTTTLITQGDSLLPKIEKVDPKKQ